MRQIGQDPILLREQQGEGNAQQHYDQLLPVYGEDRLTCWEQVPSAGSGWLSNYCQYFS